MVCVPTVSVEVVNVATPLAFKATGTPRFPAPSLNCTVPVGVPAKEVTVAVKVTLWPKSDGFTEEATAVFVAALLLVRLNEAGDAMPDAVAFTLYGPPAVALAVAEMLAWPPALMTALPPPLRAALGPLAGAVKVTTPPVTGSPKALLTVATKGEANAVVMAVLCGVPLVAAMVKPRDSKAPISTAAPTIRLKPVP